jgi:hypothetical protein
MAINVKLRFSWGHIVAAVAMIFASYVSFMGITYLTDGNFILAGIGVLILISVLCVIFIIPQALKGTDSKFGKKIIIERMLIFLAPILYVLIMVPYAHFWTVYANRTVVESTFSESIKTTKGVFESYEKYADARIMAYKTSLLQNGSDAIHVSNSVEALTLQLVDENYDSLKESAYKWIDNASGATVWNIFMLGNIKQIKDAVDGWNKILNDFSAHVMADERDDTNVFALSDPSIVAAKDSLSTLHTVYTKMGNPTVLAILTSVLLYILFLFPYMVQRRNTKSTYRLIGSERSANQINARSKDKNGDSESKDYVPFRIN